MEICFDFIILLDVDRYFEGLKKLWIEFYLCFLVL